MNPAVNAFLVSEFLGNSGRAYAEALVIFLSFIVVIWFFKKIVLLQLEKFAEKTETDLDDYAVAIVERFNWPFYIAIAFYFAFRYLTFNPLVNRGLDYFVLFVVVYYIIKSTILVVEVGTKKYIQRSQKADKNHDSSAVQVMSSLIKISVWVVAVVFLLSNFGVNISALIAGLGIGGIAVAFALQNVLADIFASFSIYFDKPFKTGDFIIIGNDMGTVKKVGIKSTRIITLQGQELIVSNKELTSTRINNYKKMERRRIVFAFGVTYDTPTEKLRRIPDMVKKIITDIKDTDVDRVHFKEFGDFSLNFEVAYYMNSPDYNRYMDAQQEMNLRIMEQFQTEKIEFAFPTQTIYVSK